MAVLIHHMEDSSCSPEEQYQQLWLAAMLQHLSRILYVTTLADNVACMRVWEDYSSWKDRRR